MTCRESFEGVIVRAIIDLGRALDVAVVAEGGDRYPAHIAGGHGMSDRPSYLFGVPVDAGFAST